MKIIAIGEILWDVFEDEERLGGAPFNFSAHSTRLGHDVRFVSAVGDDERGRRALDEARRRLGVELDYLPALPGRQTGYVTVSLTDGQPNYVIHRPAAYDYVNLAEGDVEKFTTWGADWLYFGTLLLMADGPRHVAHRLIQAAPQARRFYDINLRKRSYSKELLEELLPLASILKINEDEVRTVTRLFGEPETSTKDFCRRWAERLGWEGVCVTLGAHGCLLYLHQEFTHAPGFEVEVADAVGAGDAFSAAFLHGLNEGWPPERIGEFANRVGALVASRQGAVPDWTLEEAAALEPIKS